MAWGYATSSATLPEQEHQPSGKVQSMSPPSRRALSAKEVSEDVRAGLDDLALKQKYALSDAHLQSVLRKLVERKVLTESEVRERGRVPPVTRPAPLPIRHEQGWQCPACDSVQQQAFDECPVCGVVVSKIRNLKRNEPAFAPSFDPARSKTAPRSSRWWVPLAISVFTFVLVGGLFLQWAMHRGASSSARNRPGGTISGSSTLKNFTTANFSAEVVDVSRTIPVLVEFYADW
jgi:hypothetical protein